MLMVFLAVMVGAPLHIAEVAGEHHDAEHCALCHVFAQPAQPVLSSVLVFIGVVQFSLIVMSSAMVSPFYAELISAATPRSPPFLA